LVKTLLVAASVISLGLLTQAPAWAEGRHAGFDKDTQSTQGNSGKENDKANENNQGQTSQTYEGPKGQIDKGNFGCNNCDPVGPPDLPGKNR
jgi:hypothetical protein